MKIKEEIKNEVELEMTPQELVEDHLTVLNGYLYVINCNDVITDAQITKMVNKAEAITFYKDKGAFDYMLKIHELIINFLLDNEEFEALEEFKVIDQNLEEIKNKIE